MKSSTLRLWEEQDRHPGDRQRLFEAVADFMGDTPVLYPGSFVDLAPSFVSTSVTYVDTDRRAARFFGDAAGVDEIIAGHRRMRGSSAWRFIAADHESALGLDDESFGLLVSLYAGFVSEHCTTYLRPGGWLLVNPSHGDAAMASIDSRHRLGAVVTARSDDRHHRQQPRWVLDPQEADRGHGRAPSRHEPRRRLHAVAVRLPLSSTDRLKMSGSRHCRRRML
jgi:hypothetical protein